MKTDIHPEYQDARIVCACGSVIETRSTVEEIHVEICSSCHPFFTGKQKLIDTAGRVEKFRAKYGLEQDSDSSEREAAEEAEPEVTASEAEAAPKAEAPPEAEEAPKAKAAPKAKKSSKKKTAKTAKAEDGAATEEETEEATSEA